MILNKRCVPIVSVDQSESEKNLSDGGTKVFIVKIHDLNIKHLLLEWNLVQHSQIS